MKIDITKKTLIIAEAGVNHNGKIDIALDLVNAASDSGADIIKFQTFKANSLILKNTKKTPYQIKNTSSNNNQFQMLKLEIYLKMLSTRLKMVLVKI